MFLDELLHRVPQTRNRLLPLVKTDSEPIDLILLLEHEEWIVFHVTEELDARLHTPVVSVLLE